MNFTKIGVAQLALVSVVLLLAGVALLSVLLNIPLGLWRARVRKFSVAWFVAIHLAVPLIYYLRVKSGLGYWAIPFLVGSAVGGQIIGGKLKLERSEKAGA